MDLQDIWQEHRRFILGTLGGLIVFWIGLETVDGLFGASPAVRKAAAVARSANIELFDNADRATASQLNEELQAEFERLRSAVAFVPGEEFQLAGKGDPDTWFPQVARRVRTSILQAAQSSGVELADRDLVWPAPVGREEIAQTLIALAAMEQAALRLFNAGEAVRAVDPEALGVQAVESLKYENRSGGRRSMGRRRGRRDDEAGDLVDAQRVAFVVRCDMKTLQVWLEALRGQSPPLALEPGLKVIRGDQIDDPVTARGALAVLTVREPKR